VSFNDLHSGTRVAVIIFLLIGAFFSSLSLIVYRSSEDFLMGREKGTGTVKEMIQYTGNNYEDESSMLYKPVISFLTKDGKEITFTSGLGSNPPLFKTGETIEVLYDPSTPTNAMIGGRIFYNASIIVGVFLGGISVLFLLIGGIIFGIETYKAKRWK